MHGVLGWPRLTGSASALKGSCNERQRAPSACAIGQGGRAELGPPGLLASRLAWKMEPLVPTAQQYSLC